MEHIYDIIIIGGGPAGYTAALYASRAGLDTLIIEKMAAGGQMALTGSIENYPGFEEGIDGFTLGMKMQSGAERYGTKTLQSQVTSVQLVGNVKTVETTRASYQSRTVIIATGADPRELGLKNERELIGRGVHYCAHCDGRFYKDKIVAVVGGGNSAVSDALYLAHFAKKVILIHRRDTLRATKIYHQPLEKTPNIEIRYNCVVTEFLYDEHLTGARVSNTVNGKTEDITCDGVFVTIGRKPVTELFAGQLELDKNGYIVADESTKTGIRGVFAAGDVRTKALRQIVTATSDGAIAAHFAQEYLAAKA